MSAENERRANHRELVLARGVECRTTLPDGSKLNGVIYDVSLGGVRIIAICDELCIGMAVDLLFVFPTDEKVAYHATIIHIDEEQSFFGVQFDSDPIPVEVRPPEE